MPPVLRLVGRAFGRPRPRDWPPRTRMRYPERSSRMAIGVVMGVTLVTMFAVALESVKAVLAAASGGEVPSRSRGGPRQLRRHHDGPRRRIGRHRGGGAREPPHARRGAAPPRARTAARARPHQRAGASRRAARSSAHHDRRDSRPGSCWASPTAGRARSRCSAVSRPIPRTPPAAATLVWPAVPFWPVVVVIGATAVLTLVAAVVPTRLATRVAPVEALAE